MNGIDDLNIRICVKEDKTNWVLLNREFMTYEILYQVFIGQKWELEDEREEKT